MPFAHRTQSAHDDEHVFVVALRALAADSFGPEVAEEHACQLEFPAFFGLSGCDHAQQAGIVGDKGEEITQEPAILVDIVGIVFGHQHGNDLENGGFDFCMQVIKIPVMGIERRPIHIGAFAHLRHRGLLIGILHDEIDIRLPDHCLRHPDTTILCHLASIPHTIPDGSLPTGNKAARLREYAISACIPKRVPRACLSTSSRKFGKFSATCRLST